MVALGGEPYFSHPNDIHDIATNGYISNKKPLFHICTSPKSTCIAQLTAVCSGPR